MRDRDRDRERGRDRDRDEERRRSSDDYYDDRRDDQYHIEPGPVVMLRNLKEDVRKEDVSGHHNTIFCSLVPRPKNLAWCIYTLFAHMQNYPWYLRKTIQLHFQICGHSSALMCAMNGRSKGYSSKSGM